MKDFNKNKIIEQILLSLERFQKELGSVSGSERFFSSITLFDQMEKGVLANLLFELWERNIQSALNKYCSMIDKIKESRGNILKVNPKYNQFKREGEVIKREQDITIKDKLEKYKSLFEKTTIEINYLKDNNTSLISEGKRSYLKIYLLCATLITAFYSTVVGFYFSGDVSAINKNLVLVIIIWAAILFFLWNKLFEWINK
ncbi:hypothetical protein HY638_01145 [Candidatus Woesearchaeota archaeon]|nr:hypothetical protein [Candidatus Woesearchaeota archaeon]